ncbi:hypothetical protein ACLOAV_002679 [Pseudogymnoascus australis]
MLQDANSLNLKAQENYATKAVWAASEAPIKRKLKKVIRASGIIQAYNTQTQWNGFVGDEPRSGTLANIYVYTALMKPGDVVMGLELSHGGHISHGYKTPTRPISETAYRFNPVHYHVDLDTGLIDYNGLESLAKQHRPRIITVGGSAYSRLIDYQRVRDIADQVNALLHCDMSHFCGLVAAGAIPSPFPFCDLVTTTTSKTFRGPDAAIIFYKTWMAEEINRTIFPRFQAGNDQPHIIALAVALLQAQTEESKQQQRLVIECAQTLHQRLASYGYQFMAGGTDTHLMLIDLRNGQVEARQVERVMELANMYCNQNYVAGDKGKCSGIRLGANPMVFRGMRNPEFVQIGDLVHQAIEITKRLSSDAIARAKERNLDAPTSFKVFTDYVADGNADEPLVTLRNKVRTMARKFPPPWTAIERYSSFQ